MIKNDFLTTRGQHAYKVILGYTGAAAKSVVPDVPARGALRWFWLDGLAANLHESMLVTFIPLYALAIGATAGDIGWLSALGSLLGTAVLLPGARIAERLGAPHRLVVMTGYISRLAVLAMALLPLTGALGVWMIILLATLRAMSIQIAVPAWTSIAADIVPEGIRGRYFASRNLVMAIGGVVAVPVAGQLITSLGGLDGYRVNFFIAFILGMIGVYCYSRIEVARSDRPVIVRGKRLPLLERLRLRPNFVKFCIHAAIWNFSLQIAGPFFNVYLAQELGTSTVIIGLLATVASVASLPGQQIWGTLADRLGSKNALFWSGVLIPLAPIAWMWVTDPWHVAGINLFSGFLWAGFNLASFNFLLAATPDGRRPRYVALYSTIVGLANAGGAAFGGWLAEAYSYQIVFLLSGVGRAVGIIFLMFLVMDPSEAPERFIPSQPDPELQN